MCSYFHCQKSTWHWFSLMPKKKKEKKCDSYTQAWPKPPFPAGDAEIMQRLLRAPVHGQMLRQTSSFQAGVCGYIVVWFTELETIWCGHQGMRTMLSLTSCGVWCANWDSPVEVSNRICGSASPGGAKSQNLRIIFIYAGRDGLGPDYRENR